MQWSRLQMYWHRCLEGCKGKGETPVILLGHLMITEKIGLRTCHVSAIL